MALPAPPARCSPPAPCHARRRRRAPAGVVTLPFSVREGINIFLAGFVPTENLRFREEALTFKVRMCRGCRGLSGRQRSP